MCVCVCGGHRMLALAASRSFPELYLSYTVSSLQNFPGHLGAPRYWQALVGEIRQAQPFFHR